MLFLLKIKVGSTWYPSFAKVAYALTKCKGVIEKLWPKPILVVSCKPQLLGFAKGFSASKDSISI